jgi:hypothetical protein
MNNNFLIETLFTVSKTESTPELAEYWKNRYKLIFEKGLFELSEKTLFNLESQEPLTKPVTPFGDIVLSSHLDSNNHLDNIRLQSTIETAIRFLDGCLEAISFSPEAKNLVSQYRKIGLGIGDISEYLEKVKKSQELEEIDRVGKIVSNIAYRTSENLAEEKGSCEKWDSISKHLRPKAFEIWVDPESGNRKTGLELSEHFDIETIFTSNYKIISRRNSHILLFPPDLEWQIWSDRDETSPYTQIQLPSKTSNIIEQNNSSAVDVMVPEIYNANEESFKNQNEKPEIVIEERLEEVKPNFNQTEEAYDTLIEDKEIRDEDFIPETEENFEENKELENPKKENKKVPANKEIQTSIEENTTKNSEPEILLDDELQIGELVRITKSDDKYSNKIYQIIDVIPGDKAENNRYKLAGGSDEIDKFLWTKSNLEVVDLDDLLDEINHLVSHNEELEDGDIEEFLNEELQPRIAEKEAEIKAEYDQKLELEKAKFWQQHSNKTTPEENLEKTKLEQALNQSLTRNEDLSQKVVKLESDLEEAKQKRTEDHGQMIEEFANQKFQDYINSPKIQEEIDRQVREKVSKQTKLRPSMITGMVPRKQMSALQMMKKYSEKER